MPCKYMINDHVLEVNRSSLNRFFSVSCLILKTRVLFKQDSKMVNNYVLERFKLLYGVFYRFDPCPTTRFSASPPSTSVSSPVRSITSRLCLLFLQKCSWKTLLVVTIPHLHIENKARN